MFILLKKKKKTAYKNKLNKLA